MQLSNQLSPSVAPVVAVCIADGLAAVTLEPHAAELSEETKTAIRAAARVRVFIDARSGAAADYPQETLAFLIRNADLVCALAIADCGPAPSQDVEAAHATFDTQAEYPDWVVRLCSDAPDDWDDFITAHRPAGAHCLMSPIYESQLPAGA